MGEQITKTAKLQTVVVTAKELNHDGKAYKRGDKINVNDNQAAVLKAHSFVKSE